MNAPKRHHFVPEFYLRQWAGEDDRVPSFRLVAGIPTPRLHPNATGFEKYLYSMAKIAPEHHQKIETEFFGPLVDEPGCDAMNALLTGGISALTPRQRFFWARYLVAQRLRLPDVVNKLRIEAAEELKKRLEADHAEYAEVQGDATEPTLLEWVEKNTIGVFENFGISMLPDVIQDEKHNKFVSQMHWVVLDVLASKHKLLTCDRPLFFHPGLADPKCILAMPISPTKLFLATHDPKILTAVAGNTVDVIAKQTNVSIIRNADRIIYGEAEVAFVQKHAKLKS